MKYYMLNNDINPDLFYGGETCRCLTADEVNEVLGWFKQDDPDFTWTLESHFHEATEEDLNTYGI